MESSEKVGFRCLGMVTWLVRTSILAECFFIVLSDSPWLVGGYKKVQGHMSTGHHLHCVHSCLFILGGYCGHLVQILCATALQGVPTEFQLPVSAAPSFHTSHQWCLYLLEPAGNSYHLPKWLKVPLLHVWWVWTVCYTLFPRVSPKE
jgi:hypothetical protein